VFGQFNIDSARKSKVLLHKVVLKLFYDQWFGHKSPVMTFRGPDSSTYNVAAILGSIFELPVHIFD